MASGKDYRKELMKKFGQSPWTNADFREICGYQPSEFIRAWTFKGFIEEAPEKVREPKTNRTVRAYVFTDKPFDLPKTTYKHKLPRFTAVDKVKDPRINLMQDELKRLRRDLLALKAQNALNQKRIQKLQTQSRLKG